MDRDKIIETITQKKRYLIDYANLKGGIFFNQKSLFKSKKEIEFFLKDPSKGLPILIPSKLPYFNYKIDQKSYSINENFLYKKIFRIKKTSKSYKPLKIISSFGYLYSAQILDISGKKNKDLYEHIKKFNKLSKLQISRIIKKHKKVCAFQTRNIPHSGHELLIKNLLEKFDHVIINPVIGPKKSGDVKFSALRKAFHFLIKNKIFLIQPSLGYLLKKLMLAWPPQ